MCSWIIWSQVQSFRYRKKSLTTNLDFKIFCNLHFFHLHSLPLSVLPATSNYTSCASNSVILCFIVFFLFPFFTNAYWASTKCQTWYSWHSEKQACNMLSQCLQKQDSWLGLIVKNMEKKHSDSGKVWRFLFLTNKVSENSNAELISLLDFLLIITQKE